MKNVDRMKHRLLYRARMVVNGERRCKYFKTKAAADAQVSLWKVEAMNTISQVELAAQVHSMQTEAWQQEHKAVPLAREGAG